MNPFWPHGLAIEVLSEEGKPLSLRWDWGDHRIRDTSVHWRVHTGWWSEKEIWRDYWEVATSSGLLCTLYYDLLEGAWCLERIYE